MKTRHLIATWPVWARFLAGALILYSALLCVVSLSVFVSVLLHGERLKPADLVLQTLMTLFLPSLCLALWRPRLSSGLLFAGAAVDLTLLLFLNNTTGDGTAVMLAGSLLFLGVPMLGSAILFHRLSRP